MEKFRRGNGQLPSIVRTARGEICCEECGRKTTGGFAEKQRLNNRGREHVKIRRCDDRDVRDEDSGGQEGKKRRRRGEEGEEGEEGGRREGTWVCVKSLASASAMSDEADDLGGWGRGVKIIQEKSGVVKEVRGRNRQQGREKACKGGRAACSLGLRPRGA
eukprot:747845-Hanusia_phi.AAC.4